MTPETKKRFVKQSIVFIILFVIIEIALHCFGMKPGTLIDDFKVEENPVYQPRFISDEIGINHILPDTTTLMKGSIINQQGFRGKIDYTPTSIDSLRKNTKDNIVMIIGDSFVEGCCPDDVSKSFPDILDRKNNLSVLNFGVAGTDIVQYGLVAKKYLPQLKPDKVVIVIYLGNDIIAYDRKPMPGIPLSYPFKNNKWIYAIAPNHLSGEANHAFKNADEAYTFFLDHYTLKGKNRNLFEKAISYSIIFSKIYLFAEHKLADRAWIKKNPNLKIDVNQITYHNLKKIVTVCDSINTPYLFVAIPSPEETSLDKELKTKYKDIFRDIKWYTPENLDLTDYDGKDISNHFNNKGHIKYAEFLEKLLDQTK